MLAKRNVIVLKVFFALFLLLILRFFYFQVFLSQKLSKSAIAQRTTSINIENLRGDIFDRNFIPFTNRSKRYLIVLNPFYLNENENDLYTICEMLNLDFRQIKKEFETRKEPFIMDIDQKTRDLIIEANVKGVTVINSRHRYDENSIARHVIGYLNKIDGTGEAGIEKYYEDVLKGGRDDAVTITTDARDNVVKGVGYRLIKNEGRNKKLNVKLTLDYHIQSIVENVLDKNNISAAVVVEDVYSGDIVAMASRPDFDQRNVKMYLDSPANELFNKSVAAYNVGSIYKIIDAVLFYELGLDPLENFYCKSFINIGSNQFKCSSYNNGGHGNINLVDAFAHSCNTYFINSGLKMGYKNLVKMAERFGLGEYTGIRDQGVEEAPGNLPDPDRYYSAGDIANISIGQGEIMATPLQIADIVATIANGGIKNRINIVDSIVDDEGNKVRVVRIKEGRRVISKEVADKVKRLMEEVTIKGTGTKASLDEFGGAAGKTGTAETSRKDIVHAWFAGYFPIKNPKYSIAVFIENGKSGGDAAAPVFAQIAAEIMKKGY